MAFQEVQEHQELEAARDSQDQGEDQESLAFKALKVHLEDQEAKEILDLRATLVLKATQVPLVTVDFQEQ